MALEAKPKTSFVCYSYLSNSRLKIFYFFLACVQTSRACKMFYFFFACIQFVLQWDSCLDALASTTITSAWKWDTCLEALPCTSMTHLWQSNMHRCQILEPLDMEGMAQGADTVDVWFLFLQKMAATRYSFPGIILLQRTHWMLPRRIRNLSEWF